MITHTGRRKAAAARALPVAPATPHDDPIYEALLSATKARFAAAVADGSRLFTTDASGLWETYLDNLPAAERQFHTCHCCRSFIQRYGGLVTIGEDGLTRSAMWSAEIGGLYGNSFLLMATAAEAARVTGPFLSKETVWGTPVTGPWTHLSVTPPASHVYRERALTAGQAMAAKRQDFITVTTALDEFTAPMLDQALRIFEADALARSEKFIGPVKWLRDLHDRPKRRRGVNVLWRAIGAAPDGYCHPKSSVLGPLLEDIRAGKPFDDITRSFEAMLHPLRYQRPQAAPAAQNIKQAEELVVKLGLARSLERRYARLDEVQKV